jgi:signal transduction histidine kinase/CheY-like chemotaxis protein
MLPNPLPSAPDADRPIAPASGRFDGRRWWRGAPPMAWLLAIAAVLVATLVGVAWVQSAQNRLLNFSMRSDSFQSLWMYLQLEVESFELRERLVAVRTTPMRIDPRALSNRYEVFVSRARLVQDWEAAGVWRLDESNRETVAAIGRFILAADPVIGEGAPSPPDPQRLRELADEFDRLHAGFRDLRLFAMHAMAQDFTERREAGDQQSRLGIALIAGLFLMLVAFGAVVVRQIVRLRAGQRDLERLNENLSQARLDAVAGSMAKSRFLANMSHELRTPFQGLLGMLELIEHGPLAPEQRSHLRTATDSATHLLSVLDDVLDVSKLESGRLTLAVEPTDLPALIADIDRQMRGLAVSHGLEFTVHRGDGLPRWVATDPTRLRQILFNLLGNAIKFTASGNVRFEIEGRDGGVVRFTVTDTGIGIAEQVLDRLFSRFEQADAGTSRRYGGTGLGLEISRNLARMMGGDIVAESRVGQGSRFWLDLPLQAVAAPPAAPGPAVKLRVPPLAVLIADDNEVNCRFLKVLLERVGHRVTVSNDGRQAVDQASDADFDIVLLDLHMPVMDGFAAARAIRGLPGRRGRVRIAAVSADAQEESRHAAGDAGVDHYLVKPVRSDVVIALLEAHFGIAVEPESRPDPPPPEPAPPAASVPPGLPPADDAWVDVQRRSDLLAVISVQQLDHVTRILERQAVAAIPQLGQALAAADAQQLVRVAHSLKGAALEVGLPRVADLARDIETAARALPAAADRPALLATIASGIEQLPAAVERSMAAVFGPQAVPE